jgi:AmmeMemoRadiSam system protein A
MNYSIKEKDALLAVARNSIELYLNTGKKVYPKTDNPNFLEKRGAFVTLHIKEDLRGCIGYPLPYKPLIEAVVDNAISAATEDWRFDPITLGELDELNIEISVLTVPVKIEKHSDIVVGKHGIIISKGGKKGLLLPQVPVEQKWNLEQYLSNGCLKAGLRPDEWKTGVDIEVFEAMVFSEKH